jgi:SAM-dependent methyltransferase
VTSKRAGEPRAAQPFSFTLAITEWLVWLMPLLPVPLGVVRWLLTRDLDGEHRGYWARLRNVDELGRYAIIASLVDHFAPAGRVLDVGCADGILQERVRYGQYVGIDVHADAIRHASRKADARTSFVVADGCAYVPDRPFDVIVWNESLYYAADPMAAVERYWEHLAPGGVIIVSMFYQTFATRRLFRRLRRRWRPSAVFSVGVNSGAVWMVCAYQRA